jgi:hypothetical protein
MGWDEVSVLGLLYPSQQKIFDSAEHERKNKGLGLRVKGWG